ncbi:MAG: transcription elongation factor GreA [Lachnospiraceae bacterium]|nr:transcription elongation factor GreA [Lachnospiraceae bacterium]
MDETAANQKKSIITYKGLKKLQDELEDLKVNQRAAIAEKIKEAREQGDLSENAEYDAAKDEQAHIEGRITEIEELLKHVEVVDEDDVQKDKVSVGCTVRLLDVELGDEMEYQLVGASESNSLAGKISNESPVGKAIVGATVGQTVTVETEAGSFDYKILEIKQD